MACSLRSFSAGIIIVTSKIPIALNTELSEREIFLIGSIVSQWGFLEADIFEQTFLSFEDGDDLPAPMNNVQFCAVLELWLERVVEKQDDARRSVLKAQYDEIIYLSVSDFRQAVVHSGWDWRPDAPDEITAVRVHKKSVKRVKFTANDLAEFSTRLGQVRYRIRYPGGHEDRATELTAAGGSISSRGFELLFGRGELPDLPTD
jgi:hypothetical protein